MNEEIAKEEFAFQRRLDRLVDRELDDIERRALLESLDQRTDGWRDCALAFLEAQSWSEATSELTRASTNKSVDSATVVARSRNEAAGSSRHTIWAALAAVITVAFFAGHYYGAPPRQSNDPTPEMASLDRGGESALESSPSETDQETTRIESLAASGSSVRGGMGLSAIPADIESVLEEMGARVQRRRHMIPAQTSDGRRWVVPVEDAELVPVEYMHF